MFEKEHDCQIIISFGKTVFTNENVPFTTCLEQGEPFIAVVEYKSSKVPSAEFSTMTDFESQCLVCQEECDNKLLCGCCFHPKCLGNWFETNISCPLCCKDLSEDCPICDQRLTNRFDVYDENSLLGGSTTDPSGVFLHQDYHSQRGN